MQVPGFLALGFLVQGWPQAALPSLSPASQPQLCVWQAYRTSSGAPAAPGISRNSKQGAQDAAIATAYRAIVHAGRGWK